MWFWLGIGVIVGMGVLVAIIGPRIDPEASGRLWTLWIIVPVGVVGFGAAYLIAGPFEPDEAVQPASNAYWFWGALALGAGVWGVRTETKGRFDWRQSAPWILFGVFVSLFWFTRDPVEGEPWVVYAMVGGVVIGALGWVQQVFLARARQRDKERKEL